MSGTRPSFIIQVGMAAETTGVFVLPAAFAGFFWYVRNLAAYAIRYIRYQFSGFQACLSDPSCHPQRLHHTRIIYLEPGC